MTCDLKKIFSELAAQLPTSLNGDASITISTQNLPVPPAHLVSDRLFIRKSTHQYSYSYKVDGLDFYAHKETYSHLGLLYLAIAFHRASSETVIELTHPTSDIKNIIVECQGKDLQTLSGGYHIQPYAFVYFPREMSKHPFNGHTLPQNLPCFGLTNVNDCIVTEEDFRNRDVVRSFGNDEGSVLFAELLLNAGQLENPVNEYALEGEGGFRGVGIWSAEVTLLLPDNKLFWDSTKW